jgi:hypothetical protein
LLLRLGAWNESLKASWKQSISLMELGVLPSE